MAWRCKWCKTEVRHQKIEEKLLDKNKTPYDEKVIFLFNCPYCHSWADEIEEIAEWEED